MKGTSGPIYHNLEAKTSYKVAGSYRWTFNHIILINKDVNLYLFAQHILDKLFIAKEGKDVNTN